jgi:hypothetical protein
MRHERLAILGAAILISTGCGLEDSGPTAPPPTTNSPPTTDPNKTPDNTTNKLQPPRVDATPTTVCTTWVALRGTAPANSTVLVTGGASDVATDPNGISGRFCVDVKLRPGQVNQLKVYAHDSNLGLSAATTVSVTQNKCGDDVKKDPEPPKSRNVALGARVTSKETPDTGNNTLVTDGKTGQAAVYKGGYLGFDADLWVKVTLPKLTEVEKIVVRWRDSKGDTTQHYGREYKLLVATGNPTDPNLDDLYWTRVGEVTTGDGGVDSFDLKTKKPLVQHVALWLQQDDASFTWAETFAITEIEVWDAPRKQAASPVPEKSTCASSGSDS